MFNDICITLILSGFGVAVEILSFCLVFGKQDVPFFFLGGWLGGEVDAISVITFDL